MKIFTYLFVLLFICSSAFAVNPKAKRVDTDTSNFDGNLSGSDTTVQLALETIDELAVTGAPTDATYITQTANATLSAEQALGALATGILKNTTTTGVLSIAVDGTDFIAPGSVDISDDTNLAGDTEIVLTGDTLSIASTLARDSELHDAVTFTGTGTYISLSGQQITVDPITESDISDLSHTATAITDGLIVEADLNEDSGTPTDEDVLTYDSTGANFNWVAQSTLSAGTAAALAANGANCSTGSYPLGIDASGAVESCTDATTEIDSAISTHAGNATAHQALVTLAGTPDYITIVGQEITRGTIDISDDTNLTCGTNCTLTGDEISVDDAFLLNTGDTLTGELVLDELGLEGQPTDAITDCSGYSATGGGIFYDDSEGKWKKCQDNVLTDLDTTGSGIANVIEDTTPQLGGTLDGENNDINDVKNIVLGGTSVGTSGDAVLALTLGAEPSSSPTDAVQFYASDVPTGYGTDTIPDMTSNTAPTGTASASTEFSGSFAAWNAMTNDGTSSYWLTSSGDGTGILKYDYGSGNSATAARYTIQTYTSDLPRSPGSWTFEGSNNDSDWTTLDTQSSVSDWTSGETRTYTFSNSTAYRYYRINVSANKGDANFLHIAEIEILESSGNSAEAVVRDEAGNTTTLSPHNFRQIPDDKKEEIVSASDGMGWTYHSCRDAKCITVDMFSAIRLIEKFSGEKLIYSNANIDETPGEVTIQDLKELKNKQQP